MSNEIAFAFVVPCHNEAQNLGRLLPILEAARRDGRAAAAIVVASFASTDGSDAIVRAFAAKSAVPVTLLTGPERRGKASAINRGLDALEGNRIGVIVAVSADVLPEPGALDRLLRAFDDPAVGAAGGRPMLEPGPMGLAERLSELLWKLHHRIALASPKTTEITAFRNVGFRLDEATIADEAAIDAMVTSRGMKIAYVAEAILRTQSPTRLADYVRQRARVTEGYLRLRAAQHEVPKTLRPGARMRAALALLRDEPGAIVLFPGAVLVEAWVSLVAWRRSRRDQPEAGTWEPIASAKRPFRR